MRPKTAWIYWRFKHQSVRRRLFHSFVIIKYLVFSSMSQTIPEKPQERLWGLLARTAWRVQVVCTLPQTSAPKQAHQYVIAFCCILVSCSVWKMQTGCKHGQKVEELETWSLCRAYWCILHMLLINMNELYMYCNWIQSSLSVLFQI